MCRFMSAERDIVQLAADDLVLAAMATCHSLTIIQNQLSGDPIDLKMFDSTGWVGWYHFLKWGTDCCLS